MENNSLGQTTMMSGLISKGAGYCNQKKVSEKQSWPKLDAQCAQQIRDLVSEQEHALERHGPYCERSMSFVAMT